MLAQPREMLIPKHMRTGWKVLVPMLAFAAAIAPACGDESMDLEEQDAAALDELRDGEFGDGRVTPIASIIDASPTPRSSPPSTPRVTPAPSPSPVGTLLPDFLPRGPDRAPP